MKKYVCKDTIRPVIRQALTDHAWVDADKGDPCIIAEQFDGVAEDIAKRVHSVCNQWESPYPFAEAHD